MQYPIIDIHTHLGDVLYEDGGAIIEDGRIRKKALIDPGLIYERRDWQGFRGSRLLEGQALKAGMARSATATRANLRVSMNKHGIAYCAVMAVPPAVTFADLHAAYQRDASMLPFTGVDYAKMEGLDAQLAADVANGARGMKLHPILQRKALNSAETFQAVEAFAPHNLPVLFHSGVAEYYADSAEKTRAVPENGHIEPCLDIIKAFPNVNFIVGHAGLDGVNTVIDLLSGYNNAYVDISFQGEQVVRNLIDAFGPERVMYASDWPWGNQDVSLRIVNRIAAHDEGLKRCLLYENAARLLKIDAHAAPVKQPNNESNLRPQPQTVAG